MPAITPFQFSIAFGSSGYTDVSAYVEAGEPIRRRWGRDDQFRDATPGTFTITLNNRDARFTPGNTSSPYYSSTSTAPVEGMGACLLVGTRLTAGIIQSIQLGQTEDDWGLITLVCEDMLGVASRRQLSGGLPEALGSVSNVDTGYTVGQLALWRLDDYYGASFASEGYTTPFGPLALNCTTANSSAFGQSQMSSLVPGLTLSLAANDTLVTTASPSQSAFVFKPTAGSWLNFWAVPTATNAFTVTLVYSDGTVVLTWSGTQFTLVARTISGATYVPPSTGWLGQPHFFSLNAGTINTQLTIDGTVRSTAALSGSASVWVPTTVTFKTTTGTTSFGRVSFSSAEPLEGLALSATTEAGLLTAYDSVASDLTFGTFPTDLSTATVMYSPESASMLDKINDVVRTEQGHVYATTVGTIGSPTQRLQIISRTRPAAGVTFDSSTELADPPGFIRDISNLASTIEVQGPTQTVTYTDSAIATKNNMVELVLNTDYLDLLAYAQDRSIRGKMSGSIRAVNIVIDERTLSASRTTTLLALAPGDRITVTVPSTVLGFTSWSGWVLGVAETHQFGDKAQHRFVIQAAPVLYDVVRYDNSDVYMADGVLTLSAGIASGATTMSVATSVATTLLETVTFPYELIIDSERVQVTACTSATPQVATVTRGIAGTTAVAHSSGAAVESYSSSAAQATYAF